MNFFEKSSQTNKIRTKLILLAEEDIKNTKIKTETKINSVSLKDFESKFNCIIELKQEIYRSNHFDFSGIKIFPPLNTQTKNLSTGVSSQTEFNMRRRVSISQKKMEHFNMIFSLVPCKFEKPNKLKKKKLHKKDSLKEKASKSFKYLQKLSFSFKFDKVPIKSDDLIKNNNLLKLNELNENHKNNNKKSDKENTKVKKSQNFTSVLNSNWGDNKNLNVNNNKYSSQSETNKYLQIPFNNLKSAKNFNPRKLSSNSSKSSLLSSDPNTISDVSSVITPISDEDFKISLKYCDSDESF